MEFFVKMLSVLLFLVTFVQPVLATNYEVKCTLESDFDDWFVYVANNKVNFFDNEDAIDLLYQSTLDTYFIFKAQKSNSERLTYYFNEDASEGVLIIEGEYETKDYSFACEPYKRKS
jgi:hypothetical protein